MVVRGEIMTFVGGKSRSVVDVLRLYHLVKGGSFSTKFLSFLPSGSFPKEQAN